MERETLGAGVFFILLGFTIGLSLADYIGTRSTMTHQQIGACATGYDSALREATGLATYAVTLRDGRMVEVACVSDEADRGG